MLYIYLACIFGLLMTWGVGANDLANVMSPSLGAKAFSARKAFLIALVFECCGAFFGGTDVTHTMRHGIIETDQLMFDTSLFNLGMLSLLFSCMIWINVASYLGLPVSITHSVVGALTGFGAVVLGLNAIDWHQVGRIALSWISSPVFAGAISYAVFMSIQQLILGRPDPFKNAKRNLPVYFFLVGMLLTHMTLIKGLERMRLNWVWSYDIFIDIGCGLIASLLGYVYINRLYHKVISERHEQFKNVERMFAVLLMMTTGAMVFAHGANDVSIAVAPVSIMVSMKLHPENITALPPIWITCLGLAGVIAGLVVHGRRVIETVGSGITALTPSRAFAATFSASLTVVTLTSLGIPVSATQTLVGAVLGVGLARGIGALNIVVIRNIFTSWIITIPVASMLTICTFMVLKALVLTA